MSAKGCDQGADRLRKLKQLPSASGSACGGPGDLLRGISVSFLASEFLEDVESKGCSRESRIYDIEEKVIRARGEKQVCPRDGQLGTAYVDSIDGPGAGRSTHMLSYTWGYRIDDIATSLQVYCKDKSLNVCYTFVWICCLCINQHRVKARQQRGETVTFDEFQEHFGGTVRGVGRMIALMAPWQKPVYLARVWCVFEFFTAVQEDIPVDVIMPQEQALSFAGALCKPNGLAPLWAALEAVNVSESEASVIEDKLNISKLIDASCGCNVLNMEVIKKLQHWFADAAASLAREATQHGKSSLSVTVAFCQAAKISLHLARYDECQKLLEECQNLFRGSLDSPPDAAIQLLIEWARLLNTRGQPNEALSKLQQAADLLSPDTGPELDVALRTEIAASFCQERQLEAAQIWCESALRAHLTAGSIQTEGLAIIYHQFGVICFRCGATGAAVRAFDNCQSILQRHGISKRPTLATLLETMGVAYRNTGDLSKAFDCFEQAGQILDALGLTFTPARANLLQNFGMVHRLEQKFSRAIDAFSRGEEILIACEALSTDLGLDLIENTGDLERQRGDEMSAMKNYERALSLRRAAGKLECFEGYRLQMKLSSLDTEPKMLNDWQGCRKRAVKNQVVSLPSFVPTPVKGLLDDQDSACWLLDLPQEFLELECVDSLTKLKEAWDKVLLFEQKWHLFNKEVTSLGLDGFLKFTPEVDVPSRIAGLLESMPQCCGFSKCLSPFIVKHRNLTAVGQDLATLRQRFLNERLHFRIPYEEFAAEHSEYLVLRDLVRQQEKRHTAEKAALEQLKQEFLASHRETLHEILAVYHSRTSTDWVEPQLGIFEIDYRGIEKMAAEGLKPLGEHELILASVAHAHAADRWEFLVIECIEEGPPLPVRMFSDKCLLLRASCKDLTNVIEDFARHWAVVNSAINDFMTKASKPTASKQKLIEWQRRFQAECEVLTFATRAEVSLFPMPDRPTYWSTMTFGPASDGQEGGWTTVEIAIEHQLYLCTSTDSIENKFHSDLQHLMKQRRIFMQGQEDLMARRQKFTTQHNIFCDRWCSFRDSHSSFIDMKNILSDKRRQFEAQVQEVTCDLVALAEEVKLQEARLLMMIDKLPTLRDTVAAHVARCGRLACLEKTLLEKLHQQEPDELHEEEALPRDILEKLEVELHQQKPDDELVNVAK